MRGTDVLAMQLQGSCDLIVEHADTGERWTDRAFPTASLPGFVVWHCARILDWGVNAVVRSLPEAAARDRWRQRIRYDLGHGAGLTQAQADAAAASISACDVAEYAAELNDGIADWLSAISEEDLDATADVRAACSTNPPYATAAAWAEVAGLDGRPKWQILARPCVAHIRVHMGELDTLLALLQASSASA